MKTLGLILIGFVIGFLTSIILEPVADYHINCIGNNKVKLMDKTYNKLKTTTIDSIGYYIINVKEHE